MIENHLVSIIVPVFNSSAYLGECIDSLTRQDYSNVEIILVDDGSTDGSSEICRRKKASDNRIKFFSQSNKGVSAARNIGLSFARGEYVTFVDSDDIVDSDYVRHLLKNMSGDMDLSISGYKRYGPDASIYEQTSDMLEGTLNSCDFLVQLYRPTICGYIGYVCGKLYRLSIIRQFDIKFDEDIHYNEDRLFLCKYLCSINGGVSWNMKPTYNYFTRISGAMNSLSSKNAHLFLTDLEALVRMRKLVLSNNAEISKETEYSLLQSYHTICDLQGKNSIPFLKWRARLMLVKSLGLIKTLEIVFKLKSEN